MDTNAIVTVISNLGFPIVMCLLMYKQILNQDTRHREEIEKLSDAIQNNTLALSQLSERIKNHE